MSELTFTVSVDGTLDVNDLDFFCSKLFFELLEEMLEIENFNYEAQRDEDNDCWDVEFTLYAKQAIDREKVKEITEVLDGVVSLDIEGTEGSKHRAFMGAAW